MASNDVSKGWIWSDDYQDYYHVTYDESGQPHTQLAFSVQQAKEEAKPETVPSYVVRTSPPVPTGPRFSNPSQYSQLDLNKTVPSYIPQTPTSVPIGNRFSIPRFDTPHQGWIEQLDPSYRMRTRAEAPGFFVIGRVFAILWSEPAPSTAFLNTSHSAYTIGRFGENVYSTIRRFIVVQARRGFVYACNISNYSGQGVLKPGCIPSEHAVVYLSGTQPHYIRGELEAGMNKEPIEVIPTDSSITMRPESRIRFSKIHAVEMNVKVKDLGYVHPNSRAKLLQYYKEGYDNSETSDIAHDIFTSSPSPEPEMNEGELILLRRDVNHHLSADRMEGINSRLVGDLHSEYMVIKSPRAFFKKGRVFMVPWPEPGGAFVKDQSGPPVLVKIRRFVVIRAKASFCLCLPISTYQGQATTKPGVGVQDHAAVVLEGCEAQYHPNETELRKSPMFIKVENQTTGPIDPMSRINFAKVYTVEYNVKVRNVGRFISDSIWRMDEYFKESFGAGGT
ncbi:Nn.00g101680.m01.CDS01 [Neocucurbitaria sp. VM-36]